MTTRAVLFAMLLCAWGCEADAGASGDGGDGPPVAAGFSRIGPAGGEVSAGDGALVSFPEGAQLGQVVINVSEVTEELAAPPEGFQLVSKPYAFRPHGLSFEKEVTITLPFESSKLGKIVIRLDDEKDPEWEGLGEDRVDFERGKVTFMTDSFSIYAVAHPADAAAIECEMMGLTACNGTCVNTNDHANHCGGCRIRCGGEQRCQSGVCTGPEDAGLPMDCMLDSDCDDGSYCNGVESCPSGTCVRGDPVDCDDSNPVTVDRCDDITQMCVNDPADDAGVLE